MSLAKNFEKMFKEQVSNIAGIYCLRLYDTMFMAKGIHNPSDFVTYKKPTFYLIECKTCQTKSLPFKNIADTQFEDMYMASKIRGVKCYVVCWFYQHDKCIAYDIKYLYKLRKEGKKSVSSVDPKGITIDGIKRKKYFDWDWTALFK